MRIRSKRYFPSLVALLLLAGGCGRGPVREAGHSDLQALGVGIGHTLSEVVREGDTVLIFGIPGALGPPEQLEQEVLQGIRGELSGAPVDVKRVMYTGAEVEAYNQGQFQNLHSNFAAPALERHRGRQGLVVVSMVGWPAGNARFLPSDAIFVGVSWGSLPALNQWSSSLRGVIGIEAVGGKRPAALPGRALHKSRDEALDWFDQRFTIQQVGL